jgi:hypothetical protein
MFVFVMKTVIEIFFCTNTLKCKVLLFNFVLQSTLMVIIIVYQVLNYISKTIYNL